MRQRYVQVYLLNACPKQLTYAVPDNVQERIDAGSIIRVPIQKRREYAIVTSRSQHPVCDPNDVRDIDTATCIVRDPYYLSYIDKVCQYYAIPRHMVFRRIRQSLGSNKQPIAQKAQEQQHTEAPQHILHSEQQRIVDAIGPRIRHKQFYPTLLHGVTGSGKTHVYLELTRICLEEGGACIWLAPEVTLALELEHRLRAAFPHAACYGFHSATSAKDKHAVWHALHTQEPCIIVGVHLPVMLPIPHLRCIIVDEEHDSGFQEKKHPKISSKEAAIMRAQLYHIPIVLGSATPSIQSMHNVEQGVWSGFSLSQRYRGTIAPITIAHLTKKERRRSFWITKTLEQAIQQRLERNEQTIIFLNRRGYNFFLRCGGCGHTFCCTHCSVSLTPHQQGNLRCHYCNRTWPEPRQCPACTTSNKHFIRKGIGTQQAVTILQRLFPQARVARADLDTSVNRTKWQATLDAFTRGEIDILVGTQSITKGYDFPNVTLVGMIWADINLGMPIYNTAERTLQQMIQVAGRAGRADSSSEVIAQVMLDHELFAYAHERSYPAYYHHEITFRKTLGYPPCMRFAAIELRHEDATTLDTYADQVVHAMSHDRPRTLTILGPTQPHVSRVEGVSIRRIYVKSPSFSEIYHAYQKACHAADGIAIFLTPHPSE